MIVAGLSKSITLQPSSEFLIPLARGLLEAIKRSSKATDRTNRNLVAFRWMHEDLFIQTPMEEGVIDIKLMYRPTLAAATVSNKRTVTGLATGENAST
ncbi:UNVERIFIED_CONTAM: hypothetical protein Sradi_2163400 [Sesamum radiatum]|uniref:Uncharacterized protein n=1 Tax=Sesamum radiatum TaxID=300843 RepID=A0AAW2T378_SESRA